VTGPARLLAVRWIRCEDKHSAEQSFACAHRSDGQGGDRPAASNRIGREVTTSPCCRHFLIRSRWRIPCRRTRRR